MAMKSAARELVRPAAIVLAIAALAVGATLVESSRRASADDDTVPIAAAADVATVPGQPLNVKAEPGNGMAIVSWEAPSSDGGAKVLAYLVSYEGLRDRRIGAGARRAVVTGLTNESTYEFTVKAVNEVGAGEASVSSGPVTPQSPDSNVNGNDDGHGKGNSFMNPGAALGRAVAALGGAVKARHAFDVEHRDIPGDERADIAKVHFAAAIDRIRSALEAARDHVRTSREQGSGLATGRRQHLPVRLPSIESVMTAREAGSGLATGRRQYEPVLTADGISVPRDRPTGQSTGQRQLTPEAITEIAASIHEKLEILGEGDVDGINLPEAAFRARLIKLAEFLEEFHAVDAALAAAVQSADRPLYEHR